MKNQKWTTPKIKFGDLYYVWFRYYDSATDKMKLIIRKANANDQSLPARIRQKTIRKLRDAIEAQLKRGWNPLTNKIEYSDPREQIIDELQSMNLDQSLTFAFNKKKPDWSVKTESDYKSTVKYLKEAAAHLVILNKNITVLSRRHYIELLERVVKDRKLGAKGYNKYREHLSALMSKLEEYEVIEYNPIEKIKTKQEIQNLAHRPPTDEEKETIITHIKDTDIHYYRFICLLYGCTMRPIEIMRLQIREIDFNRQCIVFKPVENGKDQERKGKTIVYREIPIPNWLMDIFTNQMHLQKLPLDYYVFGKTSRGSFIPGKTPLGRNAATYRWSVLVKEGLKIDVDLYGLKKLAGNDLIKLQANQNVIDLLKLPQTLMGHTSKEMTEIYVSEHKKVADQVVREYMPRL